MLDSQPPQAHTVGCCYRPQLTIDVEIYCYLAPSISLRPPELYRDDHF